MQKERQMYGGISDGYGKRYLIFWLYFILGDLKGASAYIRWYEKTFEDDIGEPVHKLCCALLLRRLRKDKKAKYVLADLMLSNLYLLPKVLGGEAKVPRLRYGSNYSEEEYANEIPAEILAEISDADREWMKQLYDSIEFHRYRKRYVELNEKLDKTDGVQKRSPLVRQIYAILDELKESYS